VISQHMRSLQKQVMTVKDERIKICYEVLSGIKVIKLQAWELKFIDRVQAFRADEMLKLKSYILARSTSNSLFNGVPSLVTVVTFVTYVYLGHSMDVKTSLTCLALLSIMRYPLFVLPTVINAIVEATVSFQRLQKFLLDSEQRPVDAGHLTHVGIHAANASFAWESPIVSLSNVNVDLRKGTLCAVVGPVGCGKSTFLAGMCMRISKQAET
jgi:ATP-binding cassette subfamily C (CFTR/MRP) protein 1